jgi:hypothetical protein
MNTSPTRWELWKHESAEGIEYSFFPEDNASARSLLTPGSILIGEVLAATEVEAHTWRNEFLGWEPYEPTA